MEVSINYTIYLGDYPKNEMEDYVKYIEQRHIEIIRELGYHPSHNTYGFHRNAERFHLHYHTINKIPEDLKKKKYKILNDKIKRLKMYNQYTLPHKEFTIPEVKISFNYSDTTNWNVDKILAYPLKEYDTNEAMSNEVRPCECQGVTQPQLEIYRKQAHEIYCKSIKEYEKKEAKKTKKQNLYEHLDNVVITSNIPNYAGEIDIIVRYVVKHMLIYYKENQQCFSIHQLKNGAINYLYFKEIIDETDICNYMNI